jgi:hypothetical protein
MALIQSAGRQAEQVGQGEHQQARSTGSKQEIRISIIHKSMPKQQRAQQMYLSLDSRVRVHKLFMQSGTIFGP